MRTYILAALAERSLANNLYITDEPYGPHVLTYGERDELEQFLELGGSITNKRLEPHQLVWIMKGIGILEELYPMLEDIWNSLPPGELKKRVLGKIIYCKSAIRNGQHEDHPH